MSERLRVERSGTLLERLAEHLPGWHKRTLRQRLKLGCVRVNGVPVTRADHPLEAGDEVAVLDEHDAPTPARAPGGVALLHVDDELVAIDKPVGLLSVASPRERGRTALALVGAALGRPERPERLWPVHRLDRETSGVLLLARSREACESVRAEWDRARQTYLAVVEGEPAQESGTIDAPLWEDRNLFVRVGRAPGAREARTRWRVIERGRGASLLEVELDSGRRHQIRAHLAHLGHPVVGDPRYGTGAARMGLHALRLEVPHPRHGRELVLEAPPPAGFRALSGR
ncbi:MAG TPA: RluA family pseudouridine synthase [Planctomycetota bacterium]|nr:RluA family pseudouridine synthase [Planctomycetota bacterium]